MKNFDCIVIGGGSGGVRFARIAAQRGAKVAILEERHWGGTCVNIGCVPKKLMVYGAAFPHFLESAKVYGWNFKSEGLDFGHFQALRNAEISRLEKIYATNLEKAGVTLIEGHASFVDKKIIDVSPSPLSPNAEKMSLTAPIIVIAVGGEAMRPKIEGAELGLISDDMFALECLPKRLAVVGGGYIGLEFAGIIAGYGSKVDLIYRQDLPLRGFDEEIRQEVAKRIPLFDINVHAGHSPKILQKTEEGFRLICDGNLEIETDAVLFATGRRPNLDHLGLEKTEIQRSIDGYHLREGEEEYTTTQEGVYAIGDVLDKVNLTPFALAQGQSLAEKLFPDTAKKQRHWNFSIVPKAVFFSANISCVGLSEEEAAEQEDLHIFTSQFTPLFASLEKGQLKEREKIFIKIIVSVKTDCVLGASMIGKDAAEIIQMMAVCVANKMTKAELDATLALHPTTAEELVTLTSKPRFVLKKTGLI
ncbi:glutathione-disulfide reductase [Acetobacteraceae bacterium]|nr:glutathione-disulfide reductase [Acetobacteraceae bacterium]